MLSDAHVADFARDGYVLLDRVFTDVEMIACRDAADRILELSINSSAVLGRRHLDPRLAAIASDERLLGPLRQLMGDEPVLMEEKLNPKQTVDTHSLDLDFLRQSSFNPEVGMEGFHLHHDWGYYRQQGYPENTLSSAVASDDCAGRGPLRVIPGSHLVDAPMADPDPASGSGVVAVDFFSPDDLVGLDVPEGSVMLFHAKLVHDSEPNRSGLARRVMIYSHYPRSHDPNGDPDRRNRTVREFAQEFERRYSDLVAAGEATPTFHLDAPAPPAPHHHRPTAEIRQESFAFRSLPAESRRPDLG